MPSTDSRRLLIEYRRASVTVFWIALASTVAVAVGLLAWGAGRSDGWAVGIAAAVAVVTPGVWWRPWFEQGVRVWNGVAIRMAAMLQSYALWVVYYVVITPLGGMHRDVEPRPRHARSRWSRRRAPIPFDRREPRTALDALALFGHGHGHAWSRCLMPLVALLASLDTEGQNAAPPATTYTLY